MKPTSRVIWRIFFLLCIVVGSLIMKPAFYGATRFEGFNIGRQTLWGYDSHFSLLQDNKVLLWQLDGETFYISKSKLLAEKAAGFRVSTEGPRGTPFANWEEIDTYEDANGSLYLMPIKELYILGKSDFRGMMKVASSIYSTGPLSAWVLIIFGLVYLTCSIIFELLERARQKARWTDSASPTS